MLQVGVYKTYLTTYEVARMGSETVKLPKGLEFNKDKKSRQLETLKEVETRMKALGLPRTKIQELRKGLERETKELKDIEDGCYLRSSLKAILAIHGKPKSRSKKTSKSKKK